MLKFLAIAKSQRNKMIRVLIVSIACFCFSSCAFFARSDSTTLTRDTFVDINKVNDRSRLLKGGNLLIIPFSAGSGVAATEELDRISLMIVKGTIETLEANHAPFKILTARNADTADLVIKGHVTQLTAAKGMKNWFSGMKSLAMSVDAQMLDQETGRTVLYFSRHRTAKQKSEDYNSLAYQMGQDIGQFIVNELH